MRRVLITLSILCVACCSCNRYAAEIDTWHAERIEGLTRESGWLTLVGLHPLEPGMRTIGSDPKMEYLLPRSAPAGIGSISLDDSLVFFVPSPAVYAHIAGAADTLRGWELMNSDAKGAPTLIEVGSVQFYVVERGDDRYLRVKDKASAIRHGFKGIDRYPVDPLWRVAATLIPRDSTFTVAVPNVLGQVSESPSPGWLSFELEGKRCKLLPLGEAGESLFIIFGDETNGDGSYGGGRFLVTDPPDEMGNVILDFNRAYNPPCAFTPYATCPLPPEGNTLPLAVLAGEKTWGEAH